jgi:hypothetical protein
VTVVLTTTAAAAILASAGDTAGRVLLMLVTLAFGSWMVWNGIKVWRGEESRAVVRHERATGRWAAGWGSRRQYRSYLGAGYLLLPGGLGFGLVAATDLVRMALGRDEDWGPWWAAGYVGVGLLLVGVFGLIVYRLVGLPDGLRPPCQRGWEQVDDRLVLIRPGGTPAESRERRPLYADPPNAAAGDPPWPDPPIDGSRPDPATDSGGGPSWPDPRPGAGSGPP